MPVSLFQFLYFVFVAIGVVLVTLVLWNVVRLLWKGFQGVRDRMWNEWQWLYDYMEPGGVTEAALWVVVFLAAFAVGRLGWATIAPASEPPPTAYELSQRPELQPHFRTMLDSIQREPVGLAWSSSTPAESQPQTALDLAYKGLLRVSSGHMGRYLEVEKRVLESVEPGLCADLLSEPGNLNLQVQSLLAVDSASRAAAFDVFTRAALAELRGTPEIQSYQMSRVELTNRILLLDMLEETGWLYQVLQQLRPFSDRLICWAGNDYVETALQLPPYYQGILGRAFLVEILRPVEYLGAESPGTGVPPPGRG